MPRAAILPVVLIVTLSTTNAGACPFGFAPPPTLSELVADGDLILFVEYLDSRTPTADPDDSGSTSVLVLQSLSPLSPLDPVKLGQSLTIPGQWSGSPHELYLLQGRWSAEDGQYAWTHLEPMTPRGFRYVRQLPPSDWPEERRMAFFAQHLSSPDEVIANDSYHEIAWIPNSELGRYTDLFSVEWLRERVRNADFGDSRLSLWGVLLGLAGEPKDAELLRNAIGRCSDEFRVGLDGLMTGYVLLSGGAGLDFLVETRLSDEDVDFGEVYSVFTAVKSLKQDFPARVSKRLLRSVMHRLLDKPELEDLVVRELAEWKDWSVQESVIGKWDDSNEESYKDAIIFYLLCSAADIPAYPSLRDQQRVTAATNALAEIRKRAPEIYETEQSLWAVVADEEAIAGDTAEGFFSSPPILIDVKR